MEVLLWTITGSDGSQEPANSIGSLKILKCAHMPQPQQPNTKHIFERMILFRPNDPRHLFDLVLEYNSGLLKLSRKLTIYQYTMDNSGWKLTSTHTTEIYNVKMGTLYHDWKVQFIDEINIGLWSHNSSCFLNSYDDDELVNRPYVASVMAFNSCTNKFHLQHYALPV